MWSAISRSLPQFAPARRHQSRRQFTLERLEERSLLSTVSLTVNTTSDDPSPGGPTPGVSGRLRGRLRGRASPGRVDLGGCPPRSPTDPGLHMTRTRFLIS